MTEPAWAKEFTEILQDVGTYLMQAARAEAEAMRAAGLKFDPGTTRPGKILKRLDTFMTERAKEEAGR